MQPPVNENVFNEIQCKIKLANKDSAEELMNNAANEFNERDEESSADVTVSLNSSGANRYELHEKDLVIEMKKRRERPMEQENFSCLAITLLFDVIL